MSCHYVVRYHEIKILKLSSGTRMPTCSLSSPITACLRDFSISLDFNMNVRRLNFTVLMVVFSVVSLYVQIVDTLSANISTGHSPACDFCVLLFHTFHHSFGL